METHENFERGSYKKNTFPIKRKILIDLLSRILFAVALALFFYGVLTYKVSKSTFDHQMNQRLLTIARLTRLDLNSNWIPYLRSRGSLYHYFQNELKKHLIASDAQNILILNPEKQVLVDALGQFEFKETFFLLNLDLTAFEDALKGKATTSIFFQGKNQKIYKIAYVPLYSKSKAHPIAVLAVKASDEFVSGLRQFANILFFSGLFCLAIAGSIIFILGRRQFSPINEMMIASKKISEGDFDYRIKVFSTNELGALAHAINEMTQKLQAHNEYILESMSDGLIVVNLKKQVTTFNRAAENILNISKNNVLGLDFRDAFKNYHHLLNSMEQVIDNKIQLRNAEISILSMHKKYLNLSSTTLFGEDSRVLGTEFLFTDQTQIKQLENEIKENEKMATIGELAAGIAHEIRNPLGAIKGFSEILYRKIKNNVKAQEIVHDITKEIEILNKIVTDFLTFSKTTALDMQETNLSEVISGLLTFIQKEAKDKKIKFLFKKDPANIKKIDVEQFRRALFNVLLNAIQASPENGRIEILIEYWNFDMLNKTLKIFGYSEPFFENPVDSWVAISIKDEGSGISSENFKKIFNPFFTTRSEGFGLGLSITKKILEAHGGLILVNNRGLFDGASGAWVLMILPN
jgi:PAS domain S-box-containing protein